jgi:uncharacterized protein (TIGR02598 family)
LVEVTIALGIVSFALLAIIGLVGSGLTSVRESTNDSAIASIIQHVRAELNQADFGDLINSPDFVMLFNKSGRLIGGDLSQQPSSNAENEPFYRVTFLSADPSIPGGGDSIGNSSELVTVTVTCPDFAPRQTNRLTFLRSLKIGP